MPHLGRVLIVDDDVEWREAVGDLLEDAGYSVATAEDGQRGLEMIAASLPAVVMTDMQMPIMNGRELLARAHAVDGRLPIIVVSGNFEADASALPGAFRVLGKRGTPEKLLEAIGAAMSHRARRLPLEKLWHAAADRGAVRRRRPRSFYERFVSTMSSYLQTTSSRLVVAGAVLASALLVRKLAKA